MSVTVKSASIGPKYKSVSDIDGPSGFYNIYINDEPIYVYVDQEYDDGGWVLVLANRGYTAGMNNLTYYDAVNSINYRTNGTNNGTNDIVNNKNFYKINNLSDVNVWVGTKYWSHLSGRLTTNKITVVQYVATTNGISLNGTHTKRSRWMFDNFNESNWSMTNKSYIETELGDVPGFYSYHAGLPLTTYDNDQDNNAGNCSTYYNNNPWWYGSCWSGNYFAGGGYQDRPYWNSSGSDNHQYGAVYIK
jgi:hypothetical protein